MYLSTGWDELDPRVHLLDGGSISVELRMWSQPGAHLDIVQLFCDRDQAADLRRALAAVVAQLDALICRWCDQVHRSEEEALACRERPENVFTPPPADACPDCGGPSPDGGPCDVCIREGQRAEEDEADASRIAQAEGL